MVIALFCCSTRTRTQTDRTRICSATITPLSIAFGPQTLRWFTSRGTLRIVHFSKAGAKVLLFSELTKFF